MGTCCGNSRGVVKPAETPESHTVNPASKTDRSNHRRVKKLPQIQQPSTLNDTIPTSYNPSTLEPIQYLKNSSNRNTALTQSKKQNYNFINVLLLGESGVGKSTFINAVINYLQFHTVQDALSEKPLVVIPVSFLMTMGENFQEKIIEFGDMDPNEDHQHEGQSVTQHCRSYVFRIGSKSILRLIDTPGMGDTRGIDQDDLNMTNILSFINNLSHLNAICILLKPNESKLNVVLQSYFNRLFGFLGENCRDNIIFCFTNTRSTFFAPGDTGPLLRKMLQSHSIENIPFGKQNTFCFDNEAFRYLAACQNGIKLDDFQTNEYQQSWMTSVMESKRFLQYISHLKCYSKNQWKSIEHARFQIQQLIRPILETMRNHYRNLILYDKSASTESIKLCPSSLDSPSSICLKCRCTPKQYNGFWILSDELHNANRCFRCSCGRKEHINVDYKLDYQSEHVENRQTRNEIWTDLDKLKKSIWDFRLSLVDKSHSKEQNDSILLFLNKIIEEETRICHDKGEQCLNPLLLKELNKLKVEYERSQSQSKSNKGSIELDTIYNSITEVSNIDLVKQQIEAIKKSHENFMNQLEDRRFMKE